MSEVVVVVEAEFLPGREEEGLAALRELCEQTHANDEGCILYALHLVPDEPTRTVMIERWASMDDLRTHSQSPHVDALANVTAFVGPPRVTILEAAGFGSAEKSSLPGNLD